MPLRLLSLLLLLLLSAPLSAEPETETGMTLYVFWSVDCPHCQRQKPFLASLEARYPQLRLKQMELSRSDTYHRRFAEMASAHGRAPNAVPMLFFDGQVWSGDSAQIRTELEQALERRFGSLSLIPHPDERHLNLPLLGTINTEQASIALLTLLIAFVDGFNPCSLWVLTLLLGLVINSGSRGRIALVGLTFLTTTALIYGAFIAGVFSVLSYILYLTWVQWLVAAFALLFGLVNIKDFFWFKRGFSFTIADSHKPGIYRRLRQLTHTRLSGLALLGTTIVMAAGIALVELPCTAGFPVVWSGIMAEREISGIRFVLLLGLYLLVYLLIELAVFFTALFTLSMGRFNESHGRLLKLYGGAIMVALALALLIQPELMSSLSGSLLIFLLAALTATLILWLSRRFAARA